MSECVCRGWMGAWVGGWVGWWVGEWVGGWVGGRKTVSSGVDGFQMIHKVSGTFGRFVRLR